jgi:hypothetical protein
MKRRKITWDYHLIEAAKGIAWGIVFCAGALAFSSVFATIICASQASCTF